ncbi:DUF1800 family protein [Roseateles sp. BYS180W]|uniref:DUF1800 family protein n=1 Tax=Roseateles rivi TaxID=3299028 RepID=A0ABW7FQS3_9BURK
MKCKVSTGTKVGKLAAIGFASALVACGGGGSQVQEGESASRSQAQGLRATGLIVGKNDRPATRAEAHRFLMQATFGPTEDDINAVMNLGYREWIQSQWTAPVSSHLANFDAADAYVKSKNPTEGAYVQDVSSSFYKVALTGKDQLRQRTAYALSQIFVVSTQNDGIKFYPRTAAAYYDVLAKHVTLQYRGLLEQVTLSPAMGLYLSSMQSLKEDATTGRIPDENYAREIMQLFSIGLHKLNPDGTLQLSNGQPIPTYGPDDISGLAKVFTGWSWGGSDTQTGRFWGWCPEFCSAERLVQPMRGYPSFHSSEEKRFLGAVVPRQMVPNPHASLKVALDTLAAHPNVAPFISRQLIQRMVKSNPSPAYVARVAQAFGPSGDIKAAVTAVLLDAEARDMTQAAAADAGKVQEPVLRLTQLLRSQGASSDSGMWLVGMTDDPASELGQSPLSSPSVFNFFRPGYVPTSGEAAARGMTVPELQTVHETTVAGYTQYMLDGLSHGIGMYGRHWDAPRRDIQFNISAEMALAHQPAALVKRVTTRLLGGRSNPALESEIQAAVRSVHLDALRADGSNAQQVNEQKRNRALLTLFLTTVSPEYTVLK